MPKVAVTPQLLLQDFITDIAPYLACEPVCSIAGDCVTIQARSFSFRGESPVELGFGITDDLDWYMRLLAERSQVLPGARWEPKRKVFRLLGDGDWHDVTFELLTVE